MEIIRTLARHEVQYVIVGGFAAWIQGAPLVTVDLDLVYEPGPANIERLLLALQELDAQYRHQFGRRIVPNAAGLAAGDGAGHHLFETKAGHLDALRSAAGQAFADLRDDIQVFEISGIPTPVLGLARVIELKRAAGRDKDNAAIPVLLAALEQRLALDAEDGLKGEVQDGAESED